MIKAEWALLINKKLTKIVTPTEQEKAFSLLNAALIEILEIQ